MIRMGTSEKTDRAFQARSGQWDVDLGIDSLVDCWGWHSNAFSTFQNMAERHREGFQVLDYDDGLKIPFI